MHDMSQNVNRLAVHLENRQSIYYKQGHERKQSIKTTKQILQHGSNSIKKIRLQNNMYIQKSLIIIHGFKKINVGKKTALKKPLILE